GKYLPDPTHAFGLAGIEGLERCALSGIHLNSGVHHAEDRLVDAKAELTSDLPLDIEPLGGLADEAPLRRSTQLDVLHRGDRRRVGGEILVRNLPAVRQDHRTRGSAQGCGWDSGAFGGG